MKKLFLNYIFRVTTFFPSRCYCCFFSYFETHGKQTFRIFHFTIAIIMQKNYSTSKERKWPRKTVEYEDEGEARAGIIWKVSIDINKIFWCKVEDSGRNDCFYARGSLAKMGQPWASIFLSEIQINSWTHQEASFGELSVKYQQDFLSLCALVHAHCKTSFSWLMGTVSVSDIQQQLFACTNAVFLHYWSAPSSPNCMSFTLEFEPFCANIFIAGRSFSWNFFNNFLLLIAFAASFILSR